MTRKTRPRLGGRPPKYPLRTMAVGDTVFLPGVSGRKINQVRPAYRPMRFRVREVVLGGAQGVRVWRVE